MNFGPTNQSRPSTNAGAALPSAAPSQLSESQQAVDRIAQEMVEAWQERVQYDPAFARANQESFISIYRFEDDLVRRIEEKLAEAIDNSPLNASITDGSYRVRSDLHRVLTVIEAKGLVRLVEEPANHLELMPSKD